MKVLSLEAGRFGDNLKACVKIPYGGCTISITTEGAGVRVYDEEDNLVFVDHETNSIDTAVSFIDITDNIEE